MDIHKVYNGSLLDIFKEQQSTAQEYFRQIFKEIEEFAEDAVLAIIKHRTYGKNK